MSLVNNLDITYSTVITLQNNPSIKMIKSEF